MNMKDLLRAERALHLSARITQLAAIPIADLTYFLFEDDEVDLVTITDAELLQRLQDHLDNFIAVAEGGPDNVSLRA